MSVSIKTKVAGMDVQITEETLELAIQKASVCSQLPTTGPNGEEDLYFQYRKGTTAEGKPYEYYSIISDQAGMEFKIGQRTDGGLFPKGWEPKYQGGQNQVSGGFEEQSGPATQNTQTQQENVVQQFPQNKETANDILNKFGV